jgi:antitoxin VapB
MNEKDRRLERFCRERGVEGVWIRRRSNIAWATDGADVHVNAASELGIASLQWTPTQKLVLTDGIEAPRLRAEEPLDGWEIVARPWWEAAPIAQKNLACDFPEDCLVDLRASLMEGEVQHACGLGVDAADVVRALALRAEPGWSEQRVAGELARGLRERAIHAPVILIAADERIASFRHPIPTQKRVERTLMIVLCAQRRGLYVALTRMISFGPPAPDLCRKHEAVCAVDAALHAATRPGRRWCDLLAVAQQAYAAAGFPDEWMLHHQGGPMGYEPRDYTATPDETRAVQPNQLVGWNPSITGTKSEDTILSSGRPVTFDIDWPMLGTRPDILVR